MLAANVRKLLTERDGFGSRGHKKRVGEHAERPLRLEIRDSEAGARRTPPKFLSEREAAVYLGIPAARLTGLRKFDLVMIEKGFQPHGPPPLWQGGVCSYASETLDEWRSTQLATSRIRRSRDHKAVGSR